MDMVDYVAQMSKDTSTKIGAVLAVQGVPMTFGFNDIPEFVNDTPERRERPAKYLWTEHAERNAIYAAAAIGAQTSGATLYTTGVPCADCARAAVQAGIATVVVWESWMDEGQKSRWSESCEVGRQILEESNVYIKRIARDVEGADSQGERAERDGVYEVRG